MVSVGHRYGNGIGSVLLWRLYWDGIGMVSVWYLYGMVGAALAQRGVGIGIVPVFAPYRRGIRMVLVWRLDAQNCPSVSPPQATSELLLGAVTINRCGCSPLSGIIFTHCRR